MECQFCKNILSSAKALKAHQKCAKYCLQKQIEKTNKSIEYMFCDGCTKKFTTKREFKEHQDRCIDIKNKEIIFLKTENEKISKRIIELETQLSMFKDLSAESQQFIKEIAKQPKTTNNTTNNTNIMNLAPLDMDILTERITHVINNNMTQQHLIEGQEGVAKLIASCLVNDDGKKLIT